MVKSHGSNGPVCCDGERGFIVDELALFTAPAQLQALRGNPQEESVRDDTHDGGRCLDFARAPRGGSDSHQQVHMDKTFGARLMQAPPGD